MNRTTEFIVITLLVIATRVADGIITYMITPDLGREMNPLASGGWLVLILVAVVLIALSTFLHYHYLFNPIDNFPDEGEADLRTFKKHYFDPKSNQLIASRPGKVFAHVFGYVMPRTLILWSLLLIFNNILTLVNYEPYLEAKRQYKLWIAFYLALPIIAMILAERLQRLDFARYRGRVA